MLGRSKKISVNGAGIDAIMRSVPFATSVFFHPSQQLFPRPQQQVILIIHLFKVCRDQWLSNPLPQIRFIKFLFITQNSVFVMLLILFYRHFPLSATLSDQQQPPLDHMFVLTKAFICRWVYVNPVRVFVCKPCWESSQKTRMWVGLWENLMALEYSLMMSLIMWGPVNSFCGLI